MTTSVHAPSGDSARSTAPIGVPYASLFSSSTFLPVDDPSLTDRLLMEVWRLRQSTLLALSIKVAEEHSGLYGETGFGEAIHSFASMPPASRRALTERPAFLIWLKQTIRVVWPQGDVDSADDRTLRMRLIDFRRIMNRYARPRQGSASLVIPETSIEILRYDVDPLLAEVAPPTFDFPAPDRWMALDAGTAYSLDFFAEVATIALRRIEACWPEAYLDFTKYVRTMVHLVNVDFRSCSAERYTGVIFLTADDESVLDLEESMVHEYGHQILYNVQELAPLFAPDNGEEFSLPWSGAGRDYFGYFHAFYIYTLLAAYYGRIRDRPPMEQKRASARRSEIVRGLRHALPDLDRADRLTPAGQILFANLRHRVESLVN